MPACCSCLKIWYCEQNYRKYIIKALFSTYYKQINPHRVRFSVRPFEIPLQGLSRVRSVSLFESSQWTSQLENLSNKLKINFMKERTPFTQNIQLYHYCCMNSSWKGCLCWGIHLSIWQFRSKSVWIYCVAKVGLLIMLMNRMTKKGTFLCITTRNWGWINYLHILSWDTVRSFANMFKISNWKAWNCK